MSEPEELESVSIDRSVLLEPIGSPTCLLSPEAYADKLLLEMQEKNGETEFETYYRVEQYLKSNPVNLFQLLAFAQKSHEMKLSHANRIKAIKRLENDPKQLALRKIVEDFRVSNYPFDKRGYRAKFCKEMLAKYPIIEDIGAIENLFDRLKRDLKCPVN